MGKFIYRRYCFIEANEHPPKCIIRKRCQHCIPSETLPVTGSYIYYIEDPTLVTPEELKKVIEEKRDRRWYLCDKESFLIAKETCANMSDDVGNESWGCVVNLNKQGKGYWVGKRTDMTIPESPTVLITVDEMYLKSKMHKNRMFMAAIRSVIRVVGHSNVHRSSANHMEVRGIMPTEKQLDDIGVLPGLQKVYKANADGRCGDLLGVGAGGLPVLKNQTALCLMSGGIDSPVAAYRMMCRGCNVSGVHFLNSTNDTASVLHKNRLIAARMSEIQGHFSIHFVDISALQMQIVAHIKPMNRTVMYKWFMLYIAASLDDSYTTIVGDSMGQVASQTLPNIHNLYSTSQYNKPVIAPLIGENKLAIIDTARRIGTYNYSILEGADCCQFMVCKLGTTLSIGKSTICQSLKEIPPVEMKITTENYYNGKCIEVAKERVICCDTSDHILRLMNNRTRSLKMAGKMQHANNCGVNNGKPESVNFTSQKSDDDNNHYDNNDSPLLYFDAAATSIPHPDVIKAMNEAPIGNPNSLHQSGRAARMAVEKVRGQVAALLAVPSKDIIFTSGGTEANNIAINGFEVIRDHWSHPSTVGDIDCKKKREMVKETSNNNNCINIEETNENVKSKIQKIKVVDLVHHETGSINYNIIRPPGCDRVHVDASQGITKVSLEPLDISAIDSLTFAGHKINGPKGVGVLYLKDASNHTPLFFGGSQEGGVRPGTENVAAIVGLGAALSLDRSNNICKDVEEFIREALECLGCIINYKGATSGYIVHATLPEGINNVEFVTYLSVTYGIEIGTGSACKSGDLENVATYEFLGISPIPVQRSIRISYSAFVTMQDAERVIFGIEETILHFKKQNKIEK